MSRYKNRSNLSETVIRNIIQDYRRGMRVSELQAKYNISESTPGRLAKRQGIPLRNPRLTPDEEDRLVEDYLQKEKTAVIALEYRIAITTIREIVKRHGIPLRKPGRQ